MLFEMSSLPQSVLFYLVEQGGSLTSNFIHRQDKILNATTFDAIVSTLFNDWVSCYSPLSDKEGDVYCLLSETDRNNFLVGVQ